MEEGCLCFRYGRYKYSEKGRCVEGEEGIGKRVLVELNVDGT